MSKKTVALVTGANKGIGLEIARQLGAKGFWVWLGSRDAERGEIAAADLRAAGIDARSVILDVTDADNIRSAAALLESEAGVVDVLVNNAGIAIGRPQQPSQEPVEDMKVIFEVNAFGPVRVTQAFLPLLRKSSAGRVVMMSSGLGSIGRTADTASDIWGAPLAGYCASKAALNMFTVKLAKELLADGIKVNAADPGYTATDLNGHSGPRSVQEAATAAVDLATLGYLGPTGGFFNDGHTELLNRLVW